MSFTVHWDFENGSQNQHFQSTLLRGREEGGRREGGEREERGRREGGEGGRGVTKRALVCTLLIMLTILDDN